jgi:iron complex outermembrane recepter protein
MVNRVRRGLAVLASIVLTVAAPLSLAQSTASFDLPAQPLAEALKAVATQANINLIVPPALVEGRQAPPLRAQLTVEEALNRLLNGTGIKYHFLNEKTVVLDSGAHPSGKDSSSDRGRSGVQKNTVSDDPRLADSAASAQGPVAQANDGASPQLEEIVVTAQRREEKLKDVPLAVTALSGDQLRAQHIETGADLQNYVPSLNVSTSLTRNDYVYVIRGMGPTAGLPSAGGTTAGGGTGVVTYFAEVPTSGAGPGLFYDLENVQVANGPQGTLFGKNTTGGVILFVPRKPTNELEGSAEVGYGNYNMKTSTAVINLPVVDNTLLVRFAAQVKERDGFTIDRGPFFAGKEYDNVNYWAARASIVWRPTESLENYTIVNALHSDEHGDGYVLSAVNPAGPFAPVLEPYFAQQQAAGPRSTSFSDDEIDRRYNYGVINTTTWSISENFRFKNIFSYQVQKLENSNDVDATPFALDDLVGAPRGQWHLQTGTYTEEPQLLGTALSGNLKITAGAYYEDGANIGPQPYKLDVALGNFIAVQPNATNFERSRGIYGQTTLDLGAVADGAKGLELTTGYRYTWDDYGLGIALYSPSAGNACFSTPSGVYPQSSCLFSDSGKSSAPSWTIGVNYHLADGTLLYVRSGKGYVPGGFNPSITLTPGGTSLPQFRFAPESVIDVELGAKSEFTLGGMPTQISTDVFHSDFSNIQRAVSETLPGGVESGFTANASKAEIEGFELQGSIVPVRKLQIGLSYSYNYGKYTRIDPAAAPSLVGIPFGFLPEHKASVIANYTLPLASSVGEVTLGASYSYQTRFFAAPVVQPLDYISGYGLVNARLDWNEILRSSFDASLFVTNATDKIYRIGESSNYYTDGRIASLYGEPRMYGAQLRYRFGGK